MHIETEERTYKCENGLVEHARNVDLVVCIGSDEFAIDSFPIEDIEDIRSSSPSYVNGEGCYSVSMEGEFVVCEKIIQNTSPNLKSKR